jgi:antiviral helicase SKI2
VTAKTGSGKTLVGEFQIWHSLKKNKRVFYTTPIKSLSNQKFHDLKQMFPSVGIVTGDIQFCPQADVVILTTEILRNLLFKQGGPTEGVGLTAGLSLQDLDAVVFDEVHYINDPDRGKVWEECLMLLPAEINLVLLSATLDAPERLASWLGDLKKKPIHLISTSYRLVPLMHCVCRGESREIVMDSRNLFRDEAYADWLRRREDDQDKADKHARAVRNRGDGDAIGRGEARVHSFTHQMNAMIRRLESWNLLPALFFVLSRRKCEDYAARVEQDLVDSSDAAAIRHIVSFHLHHYP